MYLNLKINNNEELLNFVEKILKEKNYKWSNIHSRKGALRGCITIDEEKLEMHFNAIEFANQQLMCGKHISTQEFIEKFGTEEKVMSGKNRGVVNVSGNEDLFLALQNLFLSKQFNWKHSNDYGDTINRTKDLAKAKYFYFNLETKNIGGILDPKKHKVYTMDEIFSLFLFKPITVKLNSNHEAVVEKHCVKVGCQTFTFNSVEKLYEAVQKVKNSN